MIKIGQIVNKDLVSTGINQLWRIISGPITLVMIPIYLTPETQGYWYMFTSLAALAIFADLGFSNIILQFAAHEFAYLKFDANKKIIGDETHLKRLASFFRFSVKWLGIVIGIVFPSIIFIGYYYLSGKETTIAWGIPWVIYSASSGAVFIYSSMLYFFEGCNSVAQVQLIRMQVSVFTSMTMILGLYYDLQLYALSLSLLISSLSGFVLLIKNFHPSMKILWNISRNYTYSWRSEFFCLLWRYAISWCSGYFIFQLFTPLAFYYYGTVEAGKVGFSISLWTAAFSMSNVWIVAITPRVNMLIAKNDWTSLDYLFFKNLKAAVITYLVGSFFFFLIYLVVHQKWEIVDRILGLPELLSLCTCWLLQTIINAIAVYLRAHKSEPMMNISFVSSIYVAIATYICASLLDIKYLFLGYLSHYIFVLPYVIYLLFRQRRLHS